MAPTEQQLRQTKAAQISGKKKQSKARVQRYINHATQSQIKELGPKQVLLLKGRTSSNSMNKLLQELRSLQAPASKLLSKKNPIDVFTSSGGGGGGGGDGGVQSLEFLMTKNDCNLFGMTTHNKKRPNNFIIGRTFDRQLLDVVELGILYYKSSIVSAGGSGINMDVPKKRIGSKPLLLFNGDIWQNILEYSNLRNLLIDFYRGDVVDKLVVSGLDHVIVFTASYTNSTTNSNQANKSILIHQRTYHVQLKKNPNAASSGTPISELTSSGPDLDMIVRRSLWATSDLAIAARVQPRSAINKKSSLSSARSRKKNQSTNIFGETLGRLHLERQNVDKIGGRKVKALRRAEQAERQEERMAVEGELQNESNELEKEFQSTFGFTTTK
jgi:ribosome production factor 2